MEFLFFPAFMTLFCAYHLKKTSIFPLHLIIIFFLLTYFHWISSLSLDLEPTHFSMLCASSMLYTTSTSTRLFYLLISYLTELLLKYLFALYFSLSLFSYLLLLLVPFSPTLYCSLPLLTLGLRFGFDFFQFCSVVEQRHGNF